MKNNKKHKVYILYTIKTFEFINCKSKEMKEVERDLSDDNLQKCIDKVEKMNNDFIKKFYKANETKEKISCILFLIFSETYKYGIEYLKTIAGAAFNEEVERIKEK